MDRGKEGLVIDHRKNANPQHNRVGLCHKVADYQHDLHPE